MQVDKQSSITNLVGNNFAGFEKVIAFESFQGYTIVRAWILTVGLKFIKNKIQILLSRNLGNLEDNGSVCNADIWNIINFSSSSKANQTKSKRTTSKPSAITGQWTTTFAITIITYPSFNWSSARQWSSINSYLWSWHSRLQHLHGSTF